jgi:type I restriction enzyme S subunit
VKAGWQTATLDEACQFINGLWKGEVPPFVRVGVIRNTNFAKNGTLDDTDIAYLDVEAKKFAKRRLQFGDIILEKSGGGPKQPVGRVVLFDKAQGDFSFSNFTSAIRVNQPATLDPTYLHRYLYWVYLSGRTEAMQSHSTGIRNLNGDAYKAITIAFPPIAEQRRIVAILDEAFEGIATARVHAEKNLRNARELSESVVEETLTQVKSRSGEQRLGDLCQIKTGKKDVNQGNPEGQFPFFTCAAQHTYSDSYSFDTEALLVAGNGNVGQVSHYHGKFEAYQRTYVLMGFKNVQAGYLFRALDRRLSARVSKQKLGNTMPYIKIGMLTEFQVPVPTIEEQERITKQLNFVTDQVQRLETAYQAKLTALDELKQSLLHQAFSGQL